jgi:cytochrome b
VLLVLLAWRSAETRDISTHILAGSGVAGLVVFRLWWGLFGSSTARFSHFVRGPGAVFDYARSLFSGGAGEPELGHNPMGGWSVAALLSCLIGLVGLGLFAVDTDGLESGPLAALIEFDTARQASHLHALFFDGLEALVALHVLAMLFYHLVKRHNLVAAMVTGRQTLLAGRDGARPGSRVMLVIGVVLGALVAIAIARS